MRHHTSNTITMPALHALATAALLGLAAHHAPAAAHADQPAPPDQTQPQPQPQAQPQPEALPHPARKRYDDHAIVAINARTHRQLMAAMALGEMLNCRPSRHTPIELLIPHESLPALDEADLDYRIIIDNAQNLIDAEDQLRKEARRLAEQQAQAADGGPDNGVEPFFADYRSPDEINTYINALANDNPALATIIPVGQSLQGRPINAVRLTSDPSDTTRPIIFIQGCQHAREWISPASVLWAIQNLINNYGTDPEITHLLDALEWHFIPVVNPDGYQHSIDVDRFWRKNRRPNSNGSFGVDLNRNWSYEWGLSSGSSGNPNSPVYRGTAPLSEPESSAVAQYICALNGGSSLEDCPPGRVLGALDVHSYSQLILGPWSYSETVAPPREDELRIIQDDMEQAISSANGVPYTAGLGIDQLLYEASGTAQDWNFGQHNAVAWTYELRPDSPNPGFVLPPSEIIPTSIEVFEGFKVLAAYLLEHIVFILDPAPTNLQFDSPAPIPVSAIPFNRNEIDEPTLQFFYRPAGSSLPFQSLPLLGDAPDYTVQLPALTCGNEYEYFLQGLTTEGILVQQPDEALNTATGDPLPTFLAANIAPPFGGNPGGLLPCPEVPCPGDANNDDQINSDDLAILLSAFGQSVEPGTSADFDNDGDIDSDDLAILLSAFGIPC
ncbi:MAG: M14 family metallopeptidase [Phycisphaerales bacterium]